MNGDVARRLAPRVVSTPELLRLEEISRDHGFNENLDPTWLAVVISDDGNHVLTPALTHPRTRPDDGRHLRSLLRIQLRSDLPWTDAPAMHSLLDLPLEVFEALPEPSVGALNWIGELTTDGVPSVTQVAGQQDLAEARSIVNASAPFPVWGTITWLTRDQGGRRNGPPLTPWNTYYRATGFVAPNRLADGLSSVIVNVSVRNAWQSHAKLRWLVDPGPAVGPGSCILITEGPKTVAIFLVEHVESSLPRHVPPLSAQHLAEIEKRHLMATPGPWRSMVEGRDHRAGESFIMAGPDEDRGPDLYVTWDPLPSEHGRGADQDFIAHARQDVPALATEIRRLRDLLDLVSPDFETLKGETETDLSSGGHAPTVTYVVQADIGDSVVQIGAFTTMREAVKAMDLAQAEDPTADWVVNTIPVYRQARDYLADR